MTIAQEIRHRSVTIRHTHVTDSAVGCSKTLQSIANPSQSVTNPSHSFCDGFRRRKSIYTREFSLSSSLLSHCHTHPRETHVMRARGACDGFLVTDFTARLFAASLLSVFLVARTQGIDHESHLRVLSLLLPEVRQPATERMPSSFACAAPCG